MLARPSYVPHHWYPRCASRRWVSILPTYGTCPEIDHSRVQCDGFLSHFSGAGTAGAERPELERQPKRKKGRGSPPSSDVSSSGLPEMARAALGAVLCTLAACTDAARLDVAATSDGSAAEDEQTAMFCQLARSVLTWLRQLPEQGLQGMLHSVSP